MVSTKVTKYKVMKGQDHNNTDEDTKSTQNPPKRPLSPFAMNMGMIGILGFLLILSIYLFHIRMEMVRMALVVQENQMEIEALHSQLESYQDTTYNAISPAVNKIIQEEVQKSEKARYRRNSNDDSFIGVHLVGTTGPNSRRRYIQAPQQDKFFHWQAFPYHRTIAQMEIVHDPETGTYVVINTPGYYFVYTQITYRGFGDFEIGHATVRIDQQSTEVLMQTVNSQQLASAKNGRFNRRRSLDSGFQSGVFYFYPYEKVAVTPFNHPGRHEYSMDSTNSFFGLYMIHQ